MSISPTFSIISPMNISSPEYIPRIQVCEAANCSYQILHRNPTAEHGCYWNCYQWKQTTSSIHKWTWKIFACLKTNNQCYLHRRWKWVCMPGIEFIGGKIMELHLKNSLKMASIYLNLDARNNHQTFKEKEVEKSTIYTSLLIPI